MIALKALALIGLTLAGRCAAQQGYEEDANEMRAPCNIQDPLGCLQMKAWNFISSFFKKDAFNLSNLIKVNKNPYAAPEMRSADESLEDKLERFVKTRSVRVDLPLVGANVAMDATNLDEGAIDVKVNFADAAVGEGRKKSKLKKILIPIIAFVLLKAIFLLPLALGVKKLAVLGVLQLSFVSFVVTLVLAVYQFCQKMMADQVPIAAAHVAFESPYRQKRSMDAQRLAYKAHRN